MRHRHPGFTLIEVLIVVVIMAVLAATIIPQFTSSTTDAKRSARDFNSHSLQAQIELYRIDHGKYPTLAQLNDEDTCVLTHATSKDGTTAVQPDDAHPYGPYILGGKLPANPMNDSNAIVAATTNPPTDSADSGASGWQYYTNANGTIGLVWPNDTDYWTED